VIEKRLLRIEEVGEALGISRAQVYRLISGGELRATHIGRSARVAPEDLDAFVAAKRRDSQAAGAVA
jgi:excisionase family DNA binding protein